MAQKNVLSGSFKHGLNQVKLLFNAMERFGRCPITVRGPFKKLRDRTIIVFNIECNGENLGNGDGAMCI